MGLIEATSSDGRDARIAQEADMRKSLDLIWAQHEKVKELH